MKFRWDKKYLYWGVTAFSVIACSLLFYSGIFHLSSVMTLINKIIGILAPILYGLAIGYLLSPIVNFIEDKCFFPLFFKKFNISENTKNKKKIRGLSIFFAETFMLLIIFGLFLLIIPQILNSITNIIATLPYYYDNFTESVAELLENNPNLEETVISKLNDFSGTLENFINSNLIPNINEFILNLSTGVINIVLLLKNAVIGVIVSIYVLNSKELFSAQSKKLVYSIFSPHRANIVIKNARFTNMMFSGFITGKIIDSAIIGVICFGLTSIVQIPYAVLVSVIIGVTNIIPFFGPFLGAIPCAFLILLVDPLKCLYFIILIIILQTFDGNILGPKILGDSTGLSSFWVIFSILFFGGVFGILGMFIGVPVFAVIYTGIKFIINRSLDKKKLSTQTKDYMDLDNIDASTNTRIYFDKEKNENKKSIKFNKSSKHKK